MSLGTKLRRLREKKQLPLWQVGESTEVSTSQLSRIERDIDTPRSDILFRLAQFYGVTMETLMTTAAPIPQDQLSLAEVGIAAIAEKLEEMYEVEITGVTLIRSIEGNKLVRATIFYEEV